MSGFLRAAETEKTLKQQGASAGNVVANLTYLAGPKFAGATRECASAPATNAAASSLRMWIQAMDS
jgi:hypothetical protein